MRAKLKVADVGAVEVDVTITATIAELRFLKEHTQPVLGTSPFRNMLAKVISKVEEEFDAELDG